ncbi:GNAT family N-acetyltransferase [Alkalilimnicola sp. S0819]|uniref:GNAT family N-acetyltransferase n=1 Tax=Alkalilimnicola sp. S0819 TaxID=2613922 RepID=UPI0012621C64|nr:GNAT family N-acetyltransferase [Alkalilimnicola sp. S0819]KAB7619457.1 GNAT family N-acetyltransferase [Alkalilimnicola sp. S0819]MPQ17700.1 GNAT family N-acetyltransferase [Alkalilimnicola sp. S0819]
MNHQIKQLNTEDSQALEAAYEVFAALRPHLSKTQFLDQVREQVVEGYRIAFIEDGQETVAVAGFRVATFLAWGRVLYIDDLATHPQRKRAGLGGALLDWLISEGQRLGCSAVHLDTGHQRHDAHRLYLNKGFVLSSHHMSLDLR